MYPTKREFRALAAVVVALGITGVAARAASTVTTTFTGGDTQGWTGTGGFGGSTFVDTADGNPAPSLRTSFPDFGIFGIEFNNNTNAAYLGNYTQAPFTISI